MASNGAEANDPAAQQQALAGPPSAKKLEQQSLPLEEDGAPDSNKAQQFMERVTPMVQAMADSAFTPLASQQVVVRPEDAGSPPIGADGQSDLWWFYQPWASPRTVAQFISALLLIWVFEWLYLGAVFDPQSKISSVTVLVLNCDAGVNSTVAQAFPASLQPYVSSLSGVPLAAQLMSASVYNGSSPASTALNWQPRYCNGNAVGCGTAAQEAACWQQLQHDVLQGQEWAAWYWPGNTSLAHVSSFNVTGTAAALVAPPQQPVKVYQVYARARNYSTYSYILIVLQSIGLLLAQAFGLQIVGTGAVTAGLFFPTSLLPPIVIQQVDLAPVQAFGQNMSCYVIPLLTWLGSAFCVALSSQYKLLVEMQALNATTPEKRPPFKKIFFAMSIKAAACYLAMFFLSSLLVLCVMALSHATLGHIDFDRNPGVAIAFVWWLSFTYLAVNGLLLHALGIERFNSVSALLLILQLMSSGGIMSEVTSPAFFHVGRALPFYYGTRGLRTIYWGVESDVMYVNWLVLFGWNVGMSALSWIFIARKVHRSGATARPKMAPVSAVGDLALSAGI